MIIQVNDLDFAYGADEIFKNANFRVDRGEKIGLVGKNGSGKSTFFKLLTGELDADAGDIQLANDITLGYLEQNVSFDQTTTLRELFTSIFSETIAKEKRLRELEELISNEDENIDDLLEEYGLLQDFFSNGENHDYKSQIRGLANALDLTEKDLNSPYSSFSGGEKTRINLGMLLLKKPDLLLLDEPTNFLDIKTLEWLENTLKDYPGTFIVISHDRFFLDRTCTRIDEISQNRIVSYPGNYTNYLKKRQKRIEETNRHYQKVIDHINNERKIIKRYREIDSKQSNKHARSREIALSKIKLPEEIKKDKTIHFDFSPKIRSGDKVLEVSELSKAFDEENPLFSNISFEVERLDKIGIIGSNGIGKTTLFEILHKREKKDSGYFHFGSKVHPGWFDQESEELRTLEELNLIEALRESDIHLSDGEARNILAAFLFTDDDVFKKVGELSGGERARLKLAKLMLSEANFLLLDEPTNHIDLDTKEILESVLQVYSGTLLFISHDRYFLNKIANKIFEFTPDGIVEYLGNYDDYLKAKEDEKERNKLEKKESGITKTQLQKKKKKKNKARKQLRILKDEIRTLEKQITTIEEEINELETEMGNPNFYQDSVGANKKINEYNKLKETLEKKIEIWSEKTIELEEFGESI